MAYKINGTTVVDNSRNVCACCVTSCCITASDRLDAPSGNTASRPASPATGSIYFDTDEGSLLTYDGTDWKASGAEANGISSSTANALSASCPYTFYTEAYACIFKTRFNGPQPFQNQYFGNTPFWDFGTIITNCCSNLNIVGLANFCGKCLMRNQLLPQCCICNQYIREHEKPHDCSPHFLNDGSFFGIAIACQSTTDNPARYYAGCGCDQRQSFHMFACLVAANGTHGELNWPISTTSGTSCCDCVVICSFNCFCGINDLNFTHMYVPFANGPEGQCELTVGSGFTTFPSLLMGVMHSCDFGKTQFNFKYLTKSNCNCLWMMGKCRGNPVPDQHNVWKQRTGTHSCPCFKCISPFSLADFNACFCCCRCNNITYATCQCCPCVFPSWYSKKNLALLCNYCTSCALATCAAHPLNGSVTCSHLNCSQSDFYGLYWIVGHSSICCTPRCIFSCSEIMSLPSNKHFIGHMEHNPVCLCCLMFCTCSNTPMCCRNMPMLEIFDLANDCKVTCLSYKYIDRTCATASPAIILDGWACCMLQSGTFRGIIPIYDEEQTLYLQNQTDPTKHYYGIWMTGTSSGHCIGAPGQCCATNTIITFCETSCNIAITDPWVGATLKCNLSNSQYFNCCCFRPTPSSCIYTELNACPLQFCFIRPHRACYNGAACNGTPTFIEYFNPCTNSFVTTLLLTKKCGTAGYCIAGHFLACYDIENRCWAEAAAVWDAEKTAACMGCNNTDAGPIIRSTDHPGSGLCGPIFNFVKYDDGVYYQFYTHCVGRGCSHDTKFGDCLSCCCCRVCGGIANIHYKIPYGSKFCDVPGMFTETCLVEFLNFNVTNSLCCYQYQYTYPFWECVCVGKRITNSSCCFEYVGYVGPSDTFGTPTQFNQECYCSCTCCLRSIDYPAHADLTNSCVYTVSNSNADCYDSEFLTCRLGISIQPGDEKTSNRTYLTHFGKSNFKYCICNVKGCFICVHPPCVPGLTYCNYTFP